MWTLVAVRAEAAIVNVTLDDGTPIIVGGAVAPRAPQRADCDEQLHGRGGDNHPTFEDVFVATGSTSASGTSRHCAYMLSFPEMLGLPTIPATDIRYADPDGEGRYVAI